MIIIINNIINSSVLVNTYKLQSQHFHSSHTCGPWAGSTVRTSVTNCTWLKMFLDTRSKKRMFYLQEEILIRREEFFYQALYLEEYLNNVVIYCVHPFYILCVNVNVSPSVYHGAGRTS